MLRRRSQSPIHRCSNLEPAAWPAGDGPSTRFPAPTTARAARRVQAPTRPAHRPGCRPVGWKRGPSPPDPKVNRTVSRVRLESSTIRVSMHSASAWECAWRTSPTGAVLVPPQPPMHPITDPVVGQSFDGSQGQLQPTNEGGAAKAVDESGGCCSPAHMAAHVCPSLSRAGSSGIDEGDPDERPVTRRPPDTGGWRRESGLGSAGPGRFGVGLPLEEERSRRSAHQRILPIEDRGFGVRHLPGHPHHLTPQAVRLAE